MDHTGISEQDWQELVTLFGSRSFQQMKDFCKHLVRDNLTPIDKCNTVATLARENTQELLKRIDGLRNIRIPFKVEMMDSAKVQLVQRMQTTTAVTTDTTTAPGTYSNFVVYRKRTKNKKDGYTDIDVLMGLDVPGKRRIHMWIDYNTFEEISSPVPLGYNKEEYDVEWRERRICGSKTRLTADNPEYKALTLTLPEGVKSYYTHDNGGRPFLVYITDSFIKVMARPKDRYVLEEDYEDDEDGQDGPAKWMYINTVLTIDGYEKLWIGKSPKNDMTLFSGGHGPKFDGNSILVKKKQVEKDLGSEYIYIGEKISSFYTPRSHIVDFVSPVGNNDVPYPFAVDDEGTAYLLREGVTLKSSTNYDINNPYRTYYDSGIMSMSWMKDIVTRQV